VFGLQVPNPFDFLVQFGEFLLEPKKVDEILDQKRI
jgi:hypothetical protein